MDAKRVSQLVAALLDENDTITLVLSRQEAEASFYAMDISCQSELAPAEQNEEQYLAALNAVLGRLSRLLGKPPRDDFTQ